MESLDGLVIARIVEYLDGPWDIAALRATCSYLRALIAPPEKCETHDALRVGAKLGRADICTYAHSRGTWNYNWMLCEAARVGRVDLCKLARKWAADDASDAFDVRVRADIRAHHEAGLGRALFPGEYFEKRNMVGVCEFKRMMRNAGRSGSREMCELALDWAGMRGPRESQTYNMIRGAAERGDQEFLDWVLERSESKGACAHILIGAARGGHRALCERVLDEIYAAGECSFIVVDGKNERKHAAYCNFPREFTVIDDLKCIALYEAARGGHADICELLISRAIAHMCYMLSGAARGGHRALCTIAMSRGAVNYGDMMREAARGGHRELCEWAYELNGRGYIKTMLDFATYGGHRDICEYACSLGEPDFDPAIRSAYVTARVGLCKFLRGCKK
jgi:hypothetical protein